jgi:hypothetical protein
MMFVVSWTLFCISTMFYLDSHYRFDITVYTFLKIFECQ